MGDLVRVNGRIPRRVVAHRDARAAARDSQILTSVGWIDEDAVNERDRAFFRILRGPRVVVEEVFPRLGQRDPQVVEDLFLRRRRGQ